MLAVRMGDILLRGEECGASDFYGSRFTLEVDSGMGDGVLSRANLVPFHCMHRSKHSRCFFNTDGQGLGIAFFIFILRFS